MPSSLKKIILEIKKHKTLDSNILIDIIKQANVTTEDLNQLNSYNHITTESYGRNKIFETTNFAIFVMSWSPSDFTAIHSHGHSEWGAVLFPYETNHRLYDVKDNFVKLVQSAIIPKGTIVPVNGKLVHAMGNLTDKGIQTLHIYGTNNENGLTVEDSVVYEIEKQQRSTTYGSAFININEIYCKNVEKGLQTDVETLKDYLSIVLPFYQKNKLYEQVSLIEKYSRKPELYFAKQVEN